jgi:multiple sugar transport system substrate-binding protein
MARVIKREVQNVMKRSMAVLCAAGLLAASLSACSSSSDGAESKGPVKLTFWHGYTEADGKVLNQIVKDFNDSQDHVKVSTQIKPWDVIDDTLLPALSAKKGPEIVAMPAERMPVYAAKGAFASLKDFYAQDDSNTSALNKGAVDMVTVAGTQYGVPTGFVPLALFYNKALFAKAGVSAAPTTWDEWVADAKKLTVDKNGDGKPEQYGVALPDHATVANGLWPTLFYGNGGQIVEDGKTAVIDSPENAQTIEFWRKAIVDDKISPTGLDGIKSDQLFSSGKAAMTVGGPWMASIATENKIDYGIAAVPAGPTDQAVSAIGVAMGTTAQADKEERAAANEFYAYFLDKTQSVKWSLGSGWPPLRTDVAASDVSGNPVVAALTAQAQFGRPLLPGVIDSVDVLKAVDEVTQRALAGDDVATLLTKAQSTIQTDLASK